jgi:hypothetical protein
MRLLTYTEGADPNYLATVVQVPTIKDHPNADKLSLVEIYGNTIIIGKDSYKEHEKVVYFPVESCLSTKFLSWANLLTKPELNADEKTKGFFESKGRVRAVSLRGIPSQGFLFPTSKLAEFSGVDDAHFNVGEVFDSLNGELLVKKYIKGDAKGSGEANAKKSRVPKWIDATIGFFPRPIRRKAYLFVNAWFNRNAEGIKSQIVDGQFQFHYSTEHLGKNIFVLNPNDDISITSKVHGTSAIYANLLVKKTFNPFRNIANWFGATYSEVEYKEIYSSRSVLKNRRDGKYTDDVWGKHAEEFKGMIPAGYAVYGEIVGYVNHGKMVQKNYDYGVAKGESEFWVYRVTYTTDVDPTRELSWDEIEKFCVEHGFKHTPVYYHGPAVELFNLPLTPTWNSDFLTAMKEEYLDKTCGLCTTGVVNEGVVLKINNREKKPVFKFKSPKFILGESAERDAGESNIEEDS